MNNNLLQTIYNIFPEDNFLINHDNNDFTIIYKNDSHEKNRFNKYCAYIEIKKDTIYIHNLYRCGYLVSVSNFLSGKTILKKIEKLAKELGNICWIKLNDASQLIIPYKNNEMPSLKISLWALKILTTGESWYNSLGYYSIYNHKNYADFIKQSYNGTQTTIQDYISRLYTEAINSGMYVNENWIRLNDAVNELKNDINYNHELQKKIKENIGGKNNNRTKKYNKSNKRK